MAQIQHIGECAKPWNGYHYIATLEDGTSYNICTRYTDIQDIEKQVELLHICNNLFGSNSYKKCGYMNLPYYFPGGRHIIVDVRYNLYSYRDNYKIEFSTRDLYKMIKYLKKEHVNLLLPIKMPRME